MLVEERLQGFVGRLLLLLALVMVACLETTSSQACSPDNTCCMCETRYGGRPNCYYPGTQFPTGPDEVTYSVGDSGGCCSFCNRTRLYNGSYQSRVVRDIDITRYSTCPEMTCVPTGKPNEWAACCRIDRDRGNCNMGEAIPAECFKV